MKKYIPRVADNILKQRLEAKGAVLIEGAKWCGKTTTASQVAESIIYMQDPAKKEQNLRMAGVEPSILLDGKTPRLIDEWQLAPSLWDAVRFEVDQRDEFNQFILTGSSAPLDSEAISHTGTGRIARMLMRPMSLYESGDSNGTVSLKELFDGNIKKAAKSDLGIRDLAFLICRGGWPKSVNQTERIALQQAYDYFDAVVESDLSSVDGVQRNPQNVRKLMRSYARFLSSAGKLTSIRSDMAANELDNLHEDTIASYINALRRIFVVEELPAWSPNLRSKAAIRTGDTRHYVDPSIAVAALGIGPKDLLNDLNTMGFFFESMCVRDLRIFADALYGNVYHYRDKNGLECDAIVHLRNGSYGLIEVKLGERDIQEAARNLISLSEKIDTDRMKQPAFMMVLTGTEFAYQREDGVLVVPAGCLKD
ncbi:MAG: ATP-binding protein [Clostridia bacterium]|nr:ATP-binding protein [Clostridia bacterium]